MLRLSLRAKIMICCIGVVALLDFMVVAFVRSTLPKALLAECLTKGKNMASNLAESAEHLVLVQDMDHLQEHVEELKESDGDIAYVYVADSENAVLAHTFEDGFPADLSGVNTLGPADEWRRETLDTVEEGIVHDIAVPLFRGKVGVVHVGVWEHRIRRTIARLTWALVGIAGAVLLVAVGLAAIVSSVVTKPVRSLTKAAQKIRDGNLGECVVANTRDEIGELVDSFNQMSDELLKQHRVLDDRNRLIRLTQEQASWERDKLRAIIDSMAEGVIFVDAKGAISLCNKSAERIWGKSANNMLGRPLLECHPPHMHGRILKILAQAEREPGFAVAQTMEAGKGHRLSSYSSVHSEDGRYLGLVLLTSDISERIALEQEKARLRDQLFQQEKMVLIGQIAASVAHELNTPLGTILLRAQLLRRDTAGNGDLPDLEVLGGEARRCRRIIDALLGFSRRSEGVMSKADVSSLIRESLSIVEHDLELKNIVVEADYACDGATVCVDINQIQQVILNLVTNAADAMPDGGRLRIATSLQPDHGRVEIKITDNGCGMEQDVLDRALDPFFTTKERGKGTGLGLAICERIVEEHEGELEIHSRPGEGTAVSIRLPLAPLEASSDE